MRLARPLIATAIGLLLSTAANGAMGDEVLIEDFNSGPENRWEYFADTVMGGVSQGRVEFLSNADSSYMKLVGTVSTENNGGFIQSRAILSSPISQTSEGLKLRVRGNGEEYFIHIRTSRTRLPWQYYQASFLATPNWTDVNVPFSDFKPSGTFIRRALNNNDIRSLGFVAYGREHEADLEIARVSLY